MPVRKEVLIVIYQKRFLSLFLICLFLIPGFASAQSLGPVNTYEELIYFSQVAASGDTVLVSGRIDADPSYPLISSNDLIITSGANPPAILSDLHLRNARISFSNVQFINSLTIEGTSSVTLANASMSGGSNPALTFRGNGELIIDPSCIIRAENGTDGIHIEHTNGNLYVALEGNVSGGSGTVGGNGIVVSPLSSEGLVLIGGSVSGGNGSDVGGNAVNLHDLHGNAYVSLTANMQGGSGYVGGSGLQIISPQGTSNIGILGTVSGGNGDGYGGSALLLMNAADSASISLSGALIGGNSIGESSEPGQSILLVGNGGINHINNRECFLEDGRRIIDSPLPGNETYLADNPLVPEENPPTAVADATASDPVSDTPVWSGNPPSDGFEPQIVASAETNSQPGTAFSPTAVSQADPGTAPVLLDQLPPTDGSQNPAPAFTSPGDVPSPSTESPSDPGPVLDVPAESAPAVPDESGTSETPTEPASSEPSDALVESVPSENSDATSEPEPTSSAESESQEMTQPVESEASGDSAESESHDTIQPVESETSGDSAESGSELPSSSPVASTDLEQQT